MANKRGYSDGIVQEDDHCETRVEKQSKVVNVDNEKQKVSKVQRAFPPDGVTVKDDDVNDSLILLMNEDGSLSVDPKQLDSLWGMLDASNPESYTKDGSYVGKGMPATLVRISSSSSGSSVNLVVETSQSKPNSAVMPQPEEVKATESDNDVICLTNVEPKRKKQVVEPQIINNKTIPSTSDSGDHNVFIGMDRDQLLRLEKLLKSDEAKEVLGENVTAMLNMLSTEEELSPHPVAHSIVDAVHMDHNYSLQRSNQTVNEIVFEPVSQQTGVTTVPLVTTTAAPAPQSVLKTRSVGRPRKVVVPPPAAALVQPVSSNRIQPDVTSIPAVTPMSVEGSALNIQEPLEGASPTGGNRFVIENTNVEATTAPGDSTKQEEQDVVIKKGVRKSSTKGKITRTPKATRKCGRKIGVGVSPPKKSNLAMEESKLLDDAMAAALAAMEEPTRVSTVPPKTYSRVGRVKSEHGAEGNTQSMVTTENETVAAAAINSAVIKKQYPKRENRKPPAHLADAFGPALFSTPDIIRRVSLEMKMDEKDHNNATMSPVDLISDSSNAINSTDICKVLPSPENAGPAVIVLLDEAISPSKSTALALKTEPQEEHFVSQNISMEKAGGSILKLSENEEVAASREGEPEATSMTRSNSTVEEMHQVNEHGVKRRRRSAKHKSKKCLSSTDELTSSEKVSKRHKIADTDIWQPTNPDSDEEIDVESDDISWNSEDDPDRLWCICKKPHNNRFMICCDSCNFWFHGKCVGITKAMGTQMEMKEEDWTCPSCVTKQKECASEDTKIPKMKRKQFKKPGDTEAEKASTSASSQASHISIVPEKRKRLKSNNNVPVTELVNTTPTTPQAGGSKPASGAMICVVCGKNEARVNSIYCSDTCILTHAQESGQPATSTAKVPAQKPSPTKAIHQKGISPKATVQRGSPLKLILPKIEMPKPVPLRADSPASDKATADGPLNPKVARLSLNKKLTSGVINLNPVLYTLPEATTSEVMQESKAHLKPLKESHEVTKTKHVHATDSQESTPGKSETSDKAPTKVPQIHSKQTAPKVPVSKTKTVTTPSSTHTKDKPAAKKVDTKRQGSTEVQKKEEEKPVGTEPIRINVRKTLHELLLNRIQECEDLKTFPDEKVKKTALKIEEELFAFFKDTGMRYKSKYRSLVFNIKDPKNLTLFRKIVEKSVTPYQLVRLSPEELASQELANWRERESKHQLEMIKKNEMDLLSLSKTYLMKTHKGEQIIESEGVAPVDTVAEMEECLEPKEDTSEDITLPSMTIFPELLSSPSSMKEKSKKHRSHREKTHKKDKIKDKSKHSKSKHREKHHESSKSDKGDTKKHKEKDTKSQKDIKSEVTSGVESVLKKITESVQEHVIESVESVPSTTVREKKVKELLVEPLLPEIDADLEPSSTVTIETPDTNTSEYLTVWKGFISMLDVSKFLSTMQIVHGDPEDLFDNLPDHMNVVGRISPNTVWDYISKMKKSGTKDILIVRFTAANEEEHIPYIALYSYLSGRNRLGVLGKVSKMIKDFYILPLSKHNPVPQVLLPLDGPGFEDNRPHLLVGIVVRSKQKYLPADSLYKVRMPRKYTTSPSDLSSSPPERSYTPPLRVVGLTPPLPSTSLDYESTPPNSPYDPSLQIKETATLSSKRRVSTVQDDGDEPYSPGESDDDNDDVLSVNPTTQQDLQRTMDELNRKIAEQKQQIESISSAIGVPSTIREPILGTMRSLGESVSAADGEEAYSPSSSFTPPRAITPPKEPIPATEIILPSRIQTLLDDIKKDKTEISLDPIIHNFKLKFEESIIRGTSIPWKSLVDIQPDIQPYVPSEIKVVTPPLSSSLSPSIDPGFGLFTLESGKRVPSPQTTTLQAASKYIQDTEKSIVSLELSSSGSSQDTSTISFSSPETSPIKSSLSTQPKLDSKSSQVPVPTSSPDSSGVFQTIPLMLGAISPSALLPKSEKGSLSAREDFSDQGRSRASKFPKRGAPFQASRDMETDDVSPIRTPVVDEEEPPPPGVDTPPRPLPPPRCKSPQRPPPAEEVDFVQTQFTCPPPPSYQPVGYPIPTLIAPPPMPGVVYPMRPPYYGPGYMPPPPMPMGNMMHPTPGPMQMGYNPPYQEMHYPGPGGMYGDGQDHNRPHGSYGRGSDHWKYKKRGRQDDRGHDNRSRGGQTKDRSHRRDNSRDSKSNRDRSSRRKKSRNKSHSRDRTKQNASK